MMKKAFIIWRLFAPAVIAAVQVARQEQGSSACTESQLTARAEMMGRLSNDSSTSSRRTVNWDGWIYDLRTTLWTQVTRDPADDFEAK